MLQRNLHNSGQTEPSWWEELGHGAPTIAGFAKLCSHAMQHPDSRTNDQLLFELPHESKLILHLARERGTFEIRSNRDGFDSAERFLAVCVETTIDHWRLLLDKTHPEQTVRCLEGFRQLCLTGLIMHHLQREFSLSARGFEIARGVTAATAGNLIEFGMRLEI
jgi:hypothetical protein